MDRRPPCTAFGLVSKTSSLTKRKHGSARGGFGQRRVLVERHGGRCMYVILYSISFGLQYTRATYIMKDEIETLQRERKKWVWYSGGSQICSMV